MDETVTPELLLAAYARGYFPMAESRDATGIHWFYPEKRGIIPLDGFHLPARLARLHRKHSFIITADKAFPQVMAGCAGRSETWINATIIQLYCALWEKSHAHSIECWQDGALAGGLYGVALGGAFFGESMFSLRPNASKIALVHLVQLLQKTGYRLLDTQYVNAHLKQFGAIEIARKDYLVLLEEALQVRPGQAWPTTVE